MLSETKQNIEDIARKLQILDVMFDTAGRTHKESEAEVMEFLKKITKKKMVLLDELFRLID